MPVAFAIAAHPDDIEFLMAGTLILLGKAGFDLHYLNIANGCCGSTQTDRETTAAIRLEEAQAACDSIGATFHPPIVADLEVFYDLPTLRQLSSVIRQVAPDIVLTHSPADYMEDHTNSCRLAVTATFARGMPNFPTTPAAEPTNQSAAVYHAQPYGNRDPLRQPVQPDIFVNVESIHEQKTAMLACHKSQKQWLDESQGLDSYLHTMRDLDSEVGQLSGRYKLAEGWRRRIHMGFCGPDDDPLGDALADVSMRVES